MFWSFRRSISKRTQWEKQKYFFMHFHCTCIRCVINMRSDLLQKVLCIAILKRKQNNDFFIWVRRGLHDPHMKNDFNEMNVFIGLWRRNSQMPFILRTLEGYKLKNKMVRKLKLRVQFDVPII